MRAELTPVASRPVPARRRHGAGHRAAADGVAAGDAARCPACVRVMPAYPSRDEVRRRTRVPRVARRRRAHDPRSPAAAPSSTSCASTARTTSSAQIDWSSTMRLQRPIVKQYRTERNQNVVVLLDNGRLMAGVRRRRAAGRARDGRRARAVRRRASHVGDRVGLVCFDRQVRTVRPAVERAEPARPDGRGDVPARAGARRERLHRGVQPRRGAVPPAFAVRGAHRPRREHGRAGAACRRCGSSCGRHLVVVGAVQDPIVSRWAARRIRGAAVAERRLPRRPLRSRRCSSVEVAAARLRSAGAIVVDSEPGRLAVDLVDTYLDAEGLAGRL